MEIASVLSRSRPTTVCPQLAPERCPSDSCSAEANSSRSQPDLEMSKPQGPRRPGCPGRERSAQQGLSVRLGSLEQPVSELRFHWGPARLNLEIQIRSSMIR